MQDPNEKPLDLTTPEDGSIPAFLRREEPSNSEKEEVPMKTDDEAVGTAENDAPAKAPAKAKGKAPAKQASKATAKANGKGNGKHPVKAAAKATRAKAPVKAAAKAKAKAKAAPAERKRDPAKLDAFGFRKDSIKSKAAALYAKGKGATLAEVKEELGSVQFNLLTELEKKGYTVDKTEVKSDTGRMVTRYKLSGSAD